MSIFNKILISIILNILLFAGLVHAKNYPDVPTSNKNYLSITELSNQNIISGYPNGEFHPNGNINRAEAVKILINSHFDTNTIEKSLNWHKEKKHSYVIFPDVKINEWYGKFVEVAFQNKIIEGYPDKTFKPGNNINFAEALKIILESYDVNLNESQFKENKLLLVKDSDWFEPYYTYAYNHNLINQNKFHHPAVLITRGDFVEIMYRIQFIQKYNLPEFIAESVPTSNDYNITIPKLNIINLPVLFADPLNEKSALDVLKKGLGHYLSPPGSGRKTVIFGHSSGYASDKSPYKTILKQINNLKNGDRIYLNYKEKGYVYEIFKSNIIPATEDSKIITNQNIDELTLYTCWPPNSIVQRYLVYGKPI